MSLQCLYDTGDSYKVQPVYDGGVNQTKQLDTIVANCGDMFAITYSSSSLEVSFASGSEARIGGAWVKVVSTTSKTLTASSTIYLTLRIDKSQQNGYRAMFQECSSANMQKEWINGSGTIRDLLLYVITTDASGVVSVVDKRVINAGDIDISETEYEALTSSTRVPYATYNIYED